MLDKDNTKNSGFTLVELLIAMVITTIVAASVFSVYQNQQNAQLAQKQVIEMQQSLRMALYTMTSEIRMAGYDPNNTDTAGIIAAGNGSNGNPLTFSFVEDETTDALKIISYDLYVGLGDGDTDIGRAVGAAGTRQPLAENIQSLNFVYLDANGAVTAVLADIRSVQMTIVATIDSNEKNYYQGNNRTLTTTIKCRNLGL